MFCGKIQNNPYGVLVIKLETKDGRLIFNEKMNVFNVPCSDTDTTLECVEKAFLLCETLIFKNDLIISKNILVGLVTKMKDLLKCRKMVTVDYTKKLDCNYGMAVKAISTGKEALSLGSLIIFTDKKKFGNILHFEKNNGTLNWQSVDSEMDTAQTLISTKIPLVHAEVGIDDYRFSFDGMVIDREQNVVSLYIIPQNNQVINIDKSKYKEEFNRKLEDLNPKTYFMGSNFCKRQTLWRIHVQFRGDLNLIKKNVPVDTSKVHDSGSVIIHTPVCKACITRNKDVFCASLFLI